MNPQALKSVKTFKNYVQLCPELYEIVKDMKSYKSAFDDKLNFSYSIDHLRDYTNYFTNYFDRRYGSIACIRWQLSEKQLKELNKNIGKNAVYSLNDSEILVMFQPLPLKYAAQILIKKEYWDEAIVRELSKNLNAHGLHHIPIVWVP